MKKESGLSMDNMLSMSLDEIAEKTGGTRGRRGKKPEVEESKGRVNCEY